MWRAPSFCLGSRCSAGMFNKCTQNTMVGSRTCFLLETAVWRRVAAAVTGETKSSKISVDTRRKRDILMIIIILKPIIFYMDSVNFWLKCNIHQYSEICDRKLIPFDIFTIIKNFWKYNNYCYNNHDCNFSSLAVTSWILHHYAVATLCNFQYILKPYILLFLPTSISYMYRMCCYLKLHLLCKVRTVKKLIMLLVCSCWWNGKQNPMVMPFRWHLFSSTLACHYLILQLTLH